MTERDKLITSIASTCADYREDDFGKMSPDHVARWSDQFDKGVRLPVLAELDHVLKSTYLSKDRITKFLKGLAKENKLAGGDPCKFWKNANFLKEQKRGHSQVELLEVFDEVLQDACAFTTSDCGSASGAYIYLDDVIFSGDRVSTDLAAWITNKAPARVELHVVVAGIHAGGEYWLTKDDGKLKKAIKESKKQVTMQIWRLMNVENSFSRRKNSEVYWPAVLPQDAALSAYMQQHDKYPFTPRTSGGKLGPFSSEPARQLLEREMLMAGIKICSFSANPSDVVRPLGYSRFGLGFGSTIVTYRNCPNNCPLALWWGDPSMPKSHPFSKWYPLFPRKTYE